MFRSAESATELFTQKQRPSKRCSEGRQATSMRVLCMVLLLVVAGTSDPCAISESTIEVRTAPCVSPASLSHRCLSPGLSPPPHLTVIYQWLASSRQWLPGAYRLLQDLAKWYRGELQLDHVQVLCDVASTAGHVVGCRFDASPPASHGCCARCRHRGSSRGVYRGSHRGLAGRASRYGGERSLDG